MMLKKIKNASLRTKVIMAAVGFAVIAAAVIFAYTKIADPVKIVTEDVAVESVDMSRDVTAAGEVITAGDERIAISTGKVFKAMCVEEDELVTEGQHIVMYSNGTYEDAPADGFITGIKAPASGTYADATNYVTFAYADKMAIDITVPESEINNVSEGDAAEIVVNADTSKVYAGKITKKKAMSTSILGDGVQSDQGMSFSDSSQSSRLANTIAYYTVTLVFDNDGSLLPGMSAVCTIKISEKKGVTAVPVEAVRFNEEGGSYVVKVDGSHTEEVQVTTGDSDASYVEITDGLEPGDIVRVERKG